MHADDHPISGDGSISSLHLWQSARFARLKKQSKQMRERLLREEIRAPNGVRKSWMYEPAGTGRELSFVASAMVCASYRSITQMAATAPSWDTAIAPSARGVMRRSPAVSPEA